MKIGPVPMAERKKSKRHGRFLESDGHEGKAVRILSRRGEARRVEALTPKTRLTALAERVPVSTGKGI